MPAQHAGRVIYALDRVTDAVEPGAARDWIDDVLASVPPGAWVGVVAAGLMLTAATWSAARRRVRLAGQRAAFADPGERRSRDTAFTVATLVPAGLFFVMVLAGSFHGLVAFGRTALGWQAGWEYLVPGTLDGVSLTFAMLAFRAVRKEQTPDRCYRVVWCSAAASPTINFVFEYGQSGNLLAGGYVGLLSLLAMVMFDEFLHQFEEGAFNVRRVIDRNLLTAPYDTIRSQVARTTTSEELMAAEGNFRRSAWAMLDTRLPEWLQLAGRSRRPPRNAGNAFISYANGITYARVLTALRITPLHTGIAFLHSTMERQRHSLVLDLAEPFKPLFAERLLLRLAARDQLKAHHFDTDINHAMLSDTGRKLVVQTIRDELAITVNHRSLGRPVSYDELMYLEGLRLTRRVLENSTYKPFRIWW